MEIDDGAGTEPVPGPPNPHEPGPAPPHAGSNADILAQPSILMPDPPSRRATPAGWQACPWFATGPVRRFRRGFSRAGICRRPERHAPSHVPPRRIAAPACREGVDTGSAGTAWRRLVGPRSEKWVRRRGSRPAGGAAGPGVRGRASRLMGRPPSPLGDAARLALIRKLRRR